MRRSSRLVTATAIVAAIAGCAPDSAATQAPASSPQRPVTTVPAVVPDGLSMARAIRWEPWHGTRLPYTDDWGPMHETDGAATGFTHDMYGALIAMMQQQARLAAADDADWITVAKSESVVAPDDSVPTHRLPAALPTGRDLPYFAGFRWRAYTPRRAAADLALQYPDGSLASVPVVEIWDGQDWKTELRPADPPLATPLQGLDHFQPWAGVPR